MSDLIKDYMNFLNNCKTERLCIQDIIKKAGKEGYKDIKDVKKLTVGDKVYYNQMGKSIILFNVGSESLENGMNILGAHLDSPRLDVKQKPLYESDGIVYLNTHYYGGIKKYQWVTIPLSIIGVVALSDGKIINVNIGDDDKDPVFYITDILPHIAQKQMAKTGDEIIEGEKLDIVIGCSDGRKTEEKDKDVNKNRVLELIKEKYGFTEDDFMSAELEVVPSGKSRYVGLDKNLILGYGQDDKVCAFTYLMAMLEIKDVKRTTCCILVDKEEIGSSGATGMSSNLLLNATSELVYRLSLSNPELVIRRSLFNSYMLSSDVNSAYDPLNAELYDKQNSSFLAKGVVFNKYTGSRGKYSASDANAEYVAKIRSIMKDSDGDISFQMAEMAKVDIGGGGTIAKYCASYGMQVMDCGVPVQSMHAPFELTSIFDIKETFRCYKSFLKLTA